MGESFEFTLVLCNRILPIEWNNLFNLNYSMGIYNGVLKFFDNKEIHFVEIYFNNLWTYQISTDAKTLFRRDNIIDQIVLLTKAAELIYVEIGFAYAIGNIETNGSFIFSNGNGKIPSKEMMLKSSLIFVPESKVDELEINLFHIIFRNGNIICLFNPTSGILFLSESENFKILKESYPKQI
ncbi:MAG TPA: hypothetical protein PK006_13670 [Saprospiraceae bacterium]|nr:hypothetical protein [Saprospiraceae bacterium]